MWSNIISLNVAKCEGRKEVINMGWKCAIQIKGLTIGEPSPTSKHRMNLRKAAMEAGYERASKSQTLDRRRSHFNRYEGFRKGSECADTMEAEAEFVTVHMKDGTTRQRKSRSNAVPGFAMIINPPYEVCAGWDDETYNKFYQDSWNCLCEYYPRIFRDENIVMDAEHFDEGVPPEDITDVSQIDRHLHRIGYARDEDGKWCGNEIDAKFFVGLNKIFSAKMREIGWADMADLNVTDFERAKVDADYKAERDMKRGESGLSVNRHLFKKANQMIDEVVEIQEALRERELAVENREQAQQELILLGRRSKSLIEDNEEDDVLPRKERRLPNIDF